MGSCDLQKLTREKLQHEGGVHMCVVGLVISSVYIHGSASYPIQEPCVLWPELVHVQQSHGQC
jgi:hypothetical protein